MKNPVLSTDAIFHRHNGAIIEKPEYFIIRTVKQPDFYWGNFLCYKSPPDRGSMDEWIRETRKVFGPKPKHLVFSWDSEEKGEVDAFIDNGFRYVQLTALNLERTMIAVDEPLDLDLRMIQKDWEWDAVIKLQTEVGFEEEIPDPPAYEAFQKKKFHSYRMLQESGIGAWWGAFSGKELVADLGLFFDFKIKLGRFQSVETAKPHRRKGICRALLKKVYEWSVEAKNITQLTIVAESGGAAERLYQTMGFNPVATNHGLWKIDLLASEKTE
jgi:GNAT superfamily N-acetyltransferase